MLALIILAQEVGDDPSKAPFYIVGGALALFGFGLAAVGISRHAEFPPSAAAQRAVIALCLVLVVGAMFTAVVTA